MKEGSTFIDYFKVLQHGRNNFNYFRVKLEQIKMSFCFPFVQTGWCAVVADVIPKQKIFLKLIF